MIQSSPFRSDGAAAPTSRWLAAPLLLLLASAQVIGGQQEAGQPAAGPLGPMWLHASELLTSRPTMSAKLAELLARRLGPSIRASSDYRDFPDIQLAESLEGWRLLHERAQLFARDQARHYKPELGRLLTSSNVSLACNAAMERFFASIERLDAWAVQMWSASGNWPPTGLFDGIFTDLGAYRGCIDVQRPLGGGVNGSAEWAASYCMVGFRPVVPSRPRFHQIYNEESANLTRLFPARDIFERAARFAQYFHYFYMKMAICVPAECSARDLQQVSRLVGQRLALMPAPVRCITRSPLGEPSRDKLPNATAHDDDEDSEREAKPLTVSLGARLNGKQWAALLLIGSFFAVVFLVSAWHAAEVAHRVLAGSAGYSLASASSDDPNDDDCRKPHEQLDNGNHHKQATTISVGEKFAASLAISSAAAPAGSKQDCFKQRCFHYFSMLTNGREFADTRVRPNEILCLHGFRVVTMFWIVCVHTLQYNEWSGFSRAFENVASLRNYFVQPLINANYVVDNFFLMSGLLAAYTTWNANAKSAGADFSPLRCLLGRYLRLTPQVLLISLAYMLLPALSHGPFWYDMTHHAGLYCEQNWWINLLHLQSFYRSNQMCNLVGWWISVDMLYYVLALALLWLMLNQRLKLAALSTIVFLVHCTLMTAWRHYAGGFTPNNLGTVPQIGEVWTEFVTYFFWSPYPHAFVFFLGLWLGYALANRHGYALVRRHAKLGWLVSTSSLLAVNYSSRLWIAGTLDLAAGPQWLSTGYNLLCVIIWACSFGWMIVACHYGCAPRLNRLLSTELSIMLSKASFIIYLSHMLILRAFYGSQYNLLEVSLCTILIILVGMCFLSILFGVFLCIAFEGPCMKFQRFVLDSIKPARKGRQLPPLPPPASVSFLREEPPFDIKEAAAGVKQSLNSGPTSVTLLK